MKEWIPPSQLSAEKGYQQREQQVQITRQKWVWGILENCWEGESGRIQEHKGLEQWKREDLNKTTTHEMSDKGTWISNLTQWQSIGQVIWINLWSDFCSKTSFKLAGGSRAQLRSKELEVVDYHVFIWDLLKRQQGPSLVERGQILIWIHILGISGR